MFFPVSLRPCGSYQDKNPETSLDSTAWKFVTLGKFLPSGQADAIRFSLHFYNAYVWSFDPNSWTGLPFPAPEYRSGAQHEYNLCGIQGFPGFYLV
jgi:hypothetical protein